MVANKIYNISAGASFVDVLAQIYLQKYADNPDELAKVLFLLPNRRACQSLADAFVRRHDLKPTILPQIKPIAEVDEDEVFLTRDSSLLHNLLPAVDSTEKVLQFTLMIMKKSELGMDNISLAQAYALAQNLAQLTDMSYNERLDLRKIKDLVGEEYAIHWKQTLLLLQIITEYWPQILAENGKIDVAQRRNILLESEIKLWQQNQTNQHIVVAGTTAAFPILKELVKTVAELPNGAIYLYGLDKYLEDSAWEKIDENHPQYELKELLEYLNISRDSVPNADILQPFALREKIVAETMRPAESSCAWRDLSTHPIPAEQFDNIRLLNCDDLRQEAAAIALIIRHTLETPEKTAALVTMDRNLSRRVVSELQKWDINADDSAGRPLSLTQIGIYLRLIWNVLENDSQTAIISLFKHPFTACKMSRAKFTQKAMELERIWRTGAEPTPEITEFLEHFYKILRPLSELYAQPYVELQQVFKAHLEVAEKLADTDTKTGAQLIWREDDGAAAAKWVSEFINKSSLLGTIQTNDYGGLFTVLLSEQSVRKRYGTHPRVKILGPIEARLTQYDVTVIGEANEGIWPNLPQPDMWMSRPMKQEYGLPLPERQIGVSAADFAHLLNAPQVYVTRAKKIDGNPINKSRWWLRLETVLEANFGSEEGAFDFIYNQPYTYWAKNIDRRDSYMPISAPDPRPAVERRPRELSATNIEKLMRDPYIIYAKKILELYRLDDVDTPKQPYDFGNIVHKVLEKFNTKYNSDVYPEPATARKLLLEYGNEQFDAANVPAETLAFWRPRFESMMDWIISKEQAYRPQIAKIHNEIEGKISIKGRIGPFVLTAKADRIDKLKNGKLNILDYKTGNDKSVKSIVAGKAPQLPLEGLIASAGGFGGVAPATIESLQYWAFKDKFNATDAVQSAKAMSVVQSAVQNLINAYDRVEQPYLVKPRPSSAPEYSDYDHLSRIKEWGAHADTTEN